jgi:glycosyltransferase involved in cell wall biosynthesis
MIESTPAPAISVIIPAFNAGRYLAAAIESVRVQSFPPMEIIVVDDGSTDDTAAIAEAFGAPVVCHRRPHGGIAATRNFGVGGARGDWTAFLDADDLWVPEKLAWQLALAEKAPDAQLIFGATQQFVSPELAAGEQSRLATPLAKSSAPHIGTMLARREVFAQVGWFDPALQVGEFIEWFARAQDAGVPMATLPEVILQRRRHLTNTTLQQKAALPDLASAMKKILDRRRQSAAPAQS